VGVIVDDELFLDSMDNPPSFPKYTDIDGIDLEVEATPPGLPEDLPIYVDNVMISEVSLMADAIKLSDAAGGSVNLYLDAGPSNGNRKYIMLGSVTGTSPGTPLPGGQATLPLNWDIFTNIVIQLLNSGFFLNFTGTLDGMGLAQAQFNLPPGSGAVGLSMSFAYALKGPWDFASNPVTVLVEP
jgi:hypothetical protein